MSPLSPPWSSKIPSRRCRGSRENQESPPSQLFLQPGATRKCFQSNEFLISAGIPLRTKRLIFWKTLSSSYSSIQNLQTSFKSERGDRPIGELRRTQWRRVTNQRWWKLKAKLGLDTWLTDVFVVSTKERFAGPVGLLNGAKRSPACITTDQLLISHSWELLGIKNHDRKYQ